MGRRSRSRSRSRSRDRRKSSRERRSYRSRSRDKRERSRERDRRRSRSRDRRDRSRERRRSRSRSSGRERDRSRRSRSRSRDRSTRERERERERDRDRDRERVRERSERVDEAGGSVPDAQPSAGAGPPPPPSVQQQQQPGTGGDADRLARLAAWKARQGAAAAAAAPAAADSAAVPAPAVAAEAAAPKVWMPWEDPAALTAEGGAGAAAPSAAAAAVATAPAAAPPAPAPVAVFGDANEDEEDDPAVAAAAEAREAAVRERMRMDPSYVPPKVAAKRAKDMADDLARQMADGDEEDPLDAFMAAAVMPEVKQRQAEEEARRQEERRKLAEQLVTGKAPPPLKVLEESEDDDPDANPDLEIQIPANKVKLMIGPGGEKIKEIQKKSKCRVQVKKDEKELNRGFGAGFKLDLEDLQQTGDKKLATIMLFGDTKAVEMAERMILEAIENKEQKAKNRQKEYERKRDAKRRERMLYHLRHAKDYEALELPLGASKLDVKKAYRRLAMQWHPDKHPDNPDEAKAKFQDIQKAYDSLMSTSEDDIVEQLADKPQAAA
ncbi:hypothetical protein PLESTB_001958100 [Pleodorina starrii]|uniref:J domain-containing protein n=1 Tax=Pleodorina starrii TaxID=330485 RepID=A0A9W6FB18_9CHLO|nr:hypothetical protein PLESTM_000935700 [Pleodorina starrii]GLC62908.1 hypothetical protein PLESTB_001958100 [Pleodorina starrii]GLC77199.1 hypothetical protein PLESTF_001897400 [Pleodorina starrii]